MDNGFIFFNTKMRRYKGTKMDLFKDSNYLIKNDFTRLY